MMNSMIMCPSIGITLKNKKDTYIISKNCKYSSNFTCPDIVNKNVRSKRNLAFALYDLWEKSLCAPAVIPNPLKTIIAKTVKERAIWWKLYITEVLNAYTTANLAILSCKIEKVIHILRPRGETVELLNLANEFSAENLEHLI